MHVSPNKYRSALRDLPPPVEWQSKTIQRLVSAIVMGSGIVDLASAPERLRCAIDIAEIPLGMSPEQTAGIVRLALDHAEREIKRMRGILSAHGGAAFAPAADPEIAPRMQTGDTQESYMARWVQAIRERGRIVTRAGDVAFIRHPNGAYAAAGEA